MEDWQYSLGFVVFGVVLALCLFSVFEIHKCSSNIPKCMFDKIKKFFTGHFSTFENRVEKPVKQKM